MTNPYYSATSAIVPFARASASVVQGEFTKIEQGFDDVYAELGVNRQSSASTSSVAIGSGTKTFLTTTQRNFAPGQFVIAAVTASVSNYMIGQVTSYDAETGVLVISATTISGSGTFAAWTISPAPTNTGSGIISGQLLVGIGSSTFDADINGTLRVAGVLTAVEHIAMANAKQVRWGTSNVAYISGDDDSDGYLKLGTSGTDRVNINSAGTVQLVNGTGLAIARAAVTSPAATDGNVFSGTYTPTLTNVTNVAAAVPSVAQYVRIGNVVMVSGRLQVDPTTDGMFDLAISLPVASAITDATQIAGTAGAVDPSENAGALGVIFADPPTDRAVLRRTALGAGNTTYAFHFTYLVL